jgi:hypothetical protein
MRRRNGIPKDAMERIGLGETSSSGSGSAQWPTLAKEARYGLAGEMLAAIEPHTEADPVAVLINTLIAFGNAAGRSPHIKVGADRHGPCWWADRRKDAKECRGTTFANSCTLPILPGSMTRL